MDVEKTDRNFSRIDFKDQYGIDCSLQVSSLATENCIWFGVDDVNPRITVSDALNVPGFAIPISKAVEGGWMNYPIPDSVLLHSRMHLTQEQVKQLLPHLQKFADTGEL